MAEDKKAKVKVMILANVGTHTAGQTVEVSEADAEAMCQIRKRHDGHGLIDYRTAMPLAEFEKLKKAPVDKGGLTQGELDEMGIKNIVPTPVDKAFEQKLAEVKKVGEAAHDITVDEAGRSQAKELMDKKKKILGQKETA